MIVTVILFLYTEHISWKSFFYVRLLFTLWCFTWWILFNFAEKPKIVSEIKEIVANVNSSVSLNCFATGDPAPTIIWKKLSDQISHDRWENIDLIEASSVLFLNQVFFVINGFSSPSELRATEKPMQLFIKVWSVTIRSNVIRVTRCPGLPGTVPERNVTRPCQVHSGTMKRPGMKFPWAQFADFAVMFFKNQKVKIICNKTNMHISKILNWIRQNRTSNAVEHRL